ncbi:MAG TPA: 5'-methylthioadenosine/adenosylhomocysteine nucleosidase [Ruminococcaceae bacterium]|nr:5'-methylthioadenosine/adenosylhomocysteine nucleosidase [Oscillospiraceae bacterium]
MTGIIGAMSSEVEKLLEQMEEGKTEKISGITYHSGMLAGRQCVVAQCGIGKVAAAVCAQTMFLRYAPSELINVGVAGGIGSGVHIGDVVISSGLVQHDMDTTALGDKKGFISGLSLVVIPASKRLSEITVHTAEKIYGSEKVHLGIIASGDQFISDGKELGRIREDFGASACEMEGASIAQVAYMNGVPFVVIRAISDNADEKASGNFNEFCERSAHETASLITGILPKL